MGVVAYELSLSNAGGRPQRLRLEPRLFAAMPPEFQAHCGPHQRLRVEEIKIIDQIFGGVAPKAPGMPSPSPKMPHGPATRSLGRRPARMTTTPADVSSEQQAREQDLVERVAHSFDGCLTPRL
jgi:hypothetical protein